MMWLDQGLRVVCTVNLIDVVDEPFFNLVMQLVGSTSDELTLLWRSNKPLKKNAKKKERKNNLLKIYQAINRFFSSKDSTDTQEASKKEPDQVEDIEPPTTRTPSKRQLLQNKCPSRCSNYLRKLRRSLRFSWHFRRRRH